MGGLLTENVPWLPDMYTPSSDMLDRDGLNASCSSSVHVIPAPVASGTDSSQARAQSWAFIAYTHAPAAPSAFIGTGLPPHAARTTGMRAN